MADVDAGTGVAVDTDTVVDTQTDVTPPDGVTPDAGTTDAPIIQLGEKTFTESQLLEAIDAYENKQKWSGELSQKGAELNQLREMIEQARQAVINPQPVAPQVAPVQGVTGEQLRDLLLNDPNQAMSVINNLIEQSVAHTTEAVSTKQEIKNRFLSEHQDYPNTIATPEFKQFMANYPYYNEVNGYFAYQLSQAKAKLAEAEKTGFQKGEQNTINNLKAKGQIKVLTGAGAPPVAPKSQEGPLSHQQLLETITKGLEAKRMQTV